MSRSASAAAWLIPLVTFSECHKGLMNCVLDVADNDITRFPCYKEATTADDVTFLKANYGFEVQEYHEGNQSLAYHLLRCAQVRPWLKSISVI